MIILIGVSADVPHILEHRLETVLIECGPTRGTETSIIETLAYLSHGLPVSIPTERLLNDGSGERVDSEFLIYDLIAERDCAADVLTLVCRLVHPSGNFLREFLGVELSHSLQDRFEENTLGVIGNVLGRRDNPYAVLFEFGFVGSRIVSVTSKAVKFIYHDALPLPFLTICYHTLKLHSLASVVERRQSTVDIDIYNIIPVLLTEFGTDALLTLNGLLVLSLRTVPHIENDIHLTVLHPLI